MAYKCELLLSHDTKESCVDLFQFPSFPFREMRHFIEGIYRPIQGGPKITERHTSGNINKDIR